MRLKDIPRMAVRTHMPQDIRRLQKEAPRYIRAIIEKTRAIPQIQSLAELPAGSIEILEGGNMSATYSIRTGSSLTVVKLRAGGIEAEREALDAWAKHGVRIPPVLRTGVIPGTRPKIKYLLLDFVVDKKGEGAPTGLSYLTKNPKRAHSLGMLLGQTLARMHRAKSDRTFGEFSDRAQTSARFKTWNRYLVGYVRMHRAYLAGLGISRRLIRALEQTILDMKCAAQGTYLHGDYSLRNVMLTSLKPLRIVVFDPNPLIGDPSWDLAVLFNNREYAQKRYEWDPSNPEYRATCRLEQQFFEGFRKSYQAASREPVSLEAIRIAQLIQTIIHLQTEERKRYPTKAQKDIEVKVRRETLFERFGSLWLT